jgi:hypothetical protein
MAQSDVKRLLILPAIVLAAALSLTGCANLPFFGGDDTSSNNSSNDKDDKDDEEEEEEEEEEEATGSSNCPQQFLDYSELQGSNAESGLENLSLNEIEPAEFEPAVIGDQLDGGCVFTIEYTSEDAPGKIFNAFVPGGQDLQDSLDAALTADGYESMGEGFYTGTEGDYVIVYNNEDALLTEEQIEEQGLGFLGDEFLVITAYTGEV